MANKKQSKLMVPQGGMLRNLVFQAKLIMKLMGDRRVSMWAKLIPIGAFIYLVSPIDIIMGIPGIDALDDAAIVWFGSSLFIELCPPEVVNEHMKALSSNLDDNSSDDIVDAESMDVNE
jgi:uncharacterized membrane protein YkvA (DUF1232 family)